MRASSIAIAAALLGVAAARICTNATVPVIISARVAVFNIETPQTDIDVSALTANFTVQGRNFTDVITTNYTTLTKSYNISTQFCTPDSGLGLNPVVQVLTHGVGFDKT
jgi:hypothetical protein